MLIIEDNEKIDKNEIPKYSFISPFNKFDYELKNY